MVVVLGDKSQYNVSSVSSQFDILSPRVSRGQTHSGMEIDQPPSYQSEPPSISAPSTPVVQESEVVSSSLPSVSLLPFTPTGNFVDVRRAASSIKGYWRVDSSLSIPESELPPFPEKLSGPKRPNVYLKSEFGSIKAHIELVGIVPEPTEELKLHRANVRVISEAGSIKVKLTRSNNQKTAIKCTTSIGSIQLYLPHSFKGPIKIKTSLGSVKFSPKISERLTTFSDRDGERRCFLGSFRDTNYGEEGIPWVGDKAKVVSELGSIKIFYEDEVKDDESMVLESGKNKKSSFFGWSFLSGSK